MPEMSINTVTESSNIPVALNIKEVEGVNGAIVLDLLLHSNLLFYYFVSWLFFEFWTTDKNNLDEATLVTIGIFVVIHAISLVALYRAANNEVGCSTYSRLTSVYFWIISLILQIICTVFLATVQIGWARIFSLLVVPGFVICLRDVFKFENQLQILQAKKNKNGQRGNIDIQDVAEHRFAVFVVGLMDLLLHLSVLTAFIVIWTELPSEVPDDGTLIFTGGYLAFHILSVIALIIATMERVISAGSRIQCVKFWLASSLLHVILVSPAFATKQGWAVNLMVLFFLLLRGTSVDIMYKFLEDLERIAVNPKIEGRGERTPLLK